jgi:hypothetical protein
MIQGTVLGLVPRMWCELGEDCLAFYAADIGGAIKPGR